MAVGVTKQIAFFVGILGSMALLISLFFNGDIPTASDTETIVIIAASIACFIVPYSLVMLIGYVVARSKFAFRLSVLLSIAWVFLFIIQGVDVDEYMLFLSPLVIFWGLIWLIDSTVDKSNFDS